MIAAGPGVKVYLATQPCDMRKGMDGLAAQVQNVLTASPFSGALFVFRGAHFADRGRAFRAMVGADFTRSWAVWSLTDGGYGSVAEGGVKGAAARDPAHAFSSHVEAVGVVDEAVEDGVGQGRIADHLVPLLDGDPS